MGVRRWLSSGSLVSGLAGALAVGALAAPPAQAAPPREEEIVMELHHDHQNEIAMARMAQARASSSAVRDYADRLVRDHGAADRRLVAYANKIQVDSARLETPYDASNHGVMKRPDLATYSGAQFDAQFAAAMVAAHQAAIDRARTAQMMTADQQLKTLIGQTLPTLEAHLAAAEALAPDAAVPPEPDQPSR